jgi:hypothetical protein
MPRPDLTDITFVLDRSGSMQTIKQATMEAFNGFLNSQKAGEGVAQMSLVQFDDQYEVLYVSTLIGRARELTEKTYQPRGSTALLDAIGRTIIATGERLCKLREEQRPGTVIFVTLTDGYENASHEFTLQRINEMIREQRDTYSWQFIFLGANQDAIATAAQMGVGAAQAMTYNATAAGARGAMGAFDGKLHRLRAACAKGDKGAMLEFDTDDRAAALGD